jgi:hypothetical protein
VKPHRPKSNSCTNERGKEKHLRRLQTRDPKCKKCGETNPATLTGIDPNILCYECKATKYGRSSIEADHRILSELQREWPKVTLRNPDSSPLLRAAAMIRGWLDILMLLIQRILGWVPQFLERLNEHLNVTIGEQWWINIGWMGDTK